MSEIQPQSKGERAENIATWYFRLNGFFSIPSFVIHPDSRQKYPLTEADLIAVRFPLSREEIAGRLMDDDLKIIQGQSNSSGKILFVLVEVKADVCNINGPWSRPERRNMQRVIRRLGFSQEQEVDNIADELYQRAKWENDRYIVQYICVGRRTNLDLQRQYNQVIQIQWKDIASFLLRRFRDFPEKTPDGPMHIQWPDFGRQYASWYKANPGDEHDSEQAVERYIETGNCLP